MMQSISALSISTRPTKFEDRTLCSIFLTRIGTGVDYGQKNLGNMSSPLNKRRMVIRGFMQRS